MSAVQLHVGDDGILVATMDLPGRPMNVVGDELMLGIARAVERLADPAVKGLVLTSVKALSVPAAISTACRSGRDPSNPSRPATP